MGGYESDCVYVAGLVHIVRVARREVGGPDIAVNPRRARLKDAPGIQELIAKILGIGDTVVKNRVVATDEVVDRFCNNRITGHGGRETVTKSRKQECRSRDGPQTAQLQHSTRMWTL